MITKDNFKSFFKGEYSFSDIKDYFRGMFRYYIYYSKCKFLIRKHIREQISFRIEVMDKECYNAGSCKLCGCMVTALQMANKSCEKPCYPTMMNKDQWCHFKKYDYVKDKSNNCSWKLGKTAEKRLLKKEIKAY